MSLVVQHFGPWAIGPLTPPYAALRRFMSQTFDEGIVSFNMQAGPWGDVLSEPTTDMDRHSPKVLSQTHPFSTAGQALRSTRAS